MLRKNRFNQLCASATVALLCAVPQHAFAQAGFGEDPVTRMLRTAGDLLTNKWARGAAICAVAFVGYEMFKGRASIERGLWVIGGIAVIFGAGTLVDIFAPT